MRLNTPSFPFAVSALVAMTLGVPSAAGGRPPPGTAPNPEIAYLDKGIRVMNADGTNSRLVIANVGAGSLLNDPSWSPSGQQLVFTGTFGGVHGIWTVNLDGTNVQLVTPTGEGIAWQPKWSPTPGPDGQSKIVFTEHVAGVNDVFVVNLDGTGRLNLTNSPGAYEFDAAWAGDGTRLVVTRELELVVLQLGLVGGSVAVVGETPLLATSAYPLAFPCWASTSDRVAFSALVSGRFRIHTLDTANPSSVPALLTPGSTGDERWATYSPDDSRLAFHRSGTNGGIFVINSNGTGQIRINAKGTKPCWKQ